MRETCYRSDDLHVVAVCPFGSDTVVVTFSPYQFPPGLDNPGFGEAFFYKYGIDAVHVIAASNAWFQYPDIHAALDIVVARTARHARRVTYGSSMGGYAAINFSDRLGADGVIAISPQYSIDPRKMPEDRRWVHAAERIRFVHDDIAGLRRGARPIHVLYDDRNERERRQVARIGQHVDLYEIRVPFAGHPATGMLVETRLLSPTVRGLIAGGFDPAAFAAAYDAAAPHTAAYSAHLAASLPDDRAAERVCLARRAVELRPENDAYRNLLGDALAKAGAHDEAVGVLHELIERNGSVPELHYALAVALEQAQRRDEAIVAARTALALAPDSPMLWLVLGRLLGDSREDAEAEISLRRAIELSPWPTLAAFLLSRLLARQGRVSEAIAAAQIAADNAPDRADYHEHIGALQVRARDWRAAEAALAQAAALDRRPQLLLWLAVVRLRRGRAIAALTAVRTAFRAKRETTSTCVRAVPAFNTGRWLRRPGI